MTNIILKAENYVNQLLNQKLPNHFLYHSPYHTIRVVQRVKELIQHSALPKSESEPLILASWFHDTGYTISEKEHEKHSIAIATEFLTDAQVAPAILEKVSQYIRVTKMGVPPKSLGEQIICDADCAHFANKDYAVISELLRKEWELVNKIVFTDQEWIAENMTMFTQKHRYYTAYAREHWQPEKDKNLVQLIKNQKKLATVQKKEKNKKKELDRKNHKSQTPERGIETMFRVTLKNHLELSAIADTKANILLSVNAIILSLALANLLPKLDNPSNGYLVTPSIIFILASVVSIIFAILSTRPNVTSGEFTRKEIEEKKVNLLFFGNFHKMSVEAYTWGMRELMKDRDYLYNSMIKDLFFLGKVLQRKYTLLRITYAIFMSGIIISVIAFAIAFKMNM